MLTKVDVASAYWVEALQNYTMLIKDFSTQTCLQKVHAEAEINAPFPSSHDLVFYFILFK